MNSFYRGNNNRFGGGRDSHRQDFGRDRQMYRTTCAKCGNDCEVPFKPTGERPVYCNNCFKSMRDSGPGRSDDRDSRGRRDNYSENRNDRGNGNNEGQFKKQFESLNWKLDKILKILTPAAPPKAVQEEKIEEKVKVIKPKKSAKSIKKENPVVEETVSAKISTGADVAADEDKLVL